MELSASNFDTLIKFGEIGMRDNIVQLYLIFAETA